MANVRDSSIATTTTEERKNDPSFLVIIIIENRAENYKALKSVYQNS